MSHRRQVWETLSNLLTRVEEGIETTSGPGANGTALKELEKELRKLGKAQFKANVLAEDQATRWEELLTSVKEEQEQRDQLVETMVSERVAAARDELLESILPALDGVEKAIASGRRYLRVRDRAASSTNPREEQATSASSDDRAMLAGWLDGLRLVRERLLTILESRDVTPIPTVGRRFDPYLHVAVGTTSEGEDPPGTIVEEERRGYRTPDGVLRYAEVIVHRPEEGSGGKQAGSDGNGRLKEATTAGQTRAYDEAIREIRRMFKETDARLDRRFAETDERIEELSARFTSRWDGMIQAMVEPDAMRLFQERGISVRRTYQRVRGRQDDRHMEIDLVLEDAAVVIAIEAKSTLRVRDVRDFLDGMGEFPSFFPRYRDYQVHGGVAGLDIVEDADRFACQRGLFVLTVAEGGLVRILNEETFEPKNFAA